MPPACVLMVTVGTSLFSNLGRPLRDASGPDVAAKQAALKEAVERDDCAGAAKILAELPPMERLCGAEINSCHQLLDDRLVRKDSAIVLFHSATDNGRKVGAILAGVFKLRGHDAKAVEVPGLQDQNPDAFRRVGLPGLANELCRCLRDNGVTNCAINATGGYKAQIAVAVVIGQALRVPVYYMHESFSSIIAIPPMPVSLDMELWLRHSALFYRLAANLAEPVRAEEFGQDWKSALDDPDDLDDLVECERVDGQEYLSLNSTGVVFHQTHRERFGHLANRLPPAAAEGAKRKPRFKQGEGHTARHGEGVARWMQKLTDEVPQVIQCVVKKHNPDRPECNGFRPSGEDVVGVYSDGTWAITFEVLSTAKTADQRLALVAKLNEWATGQR